MVNTLDYAPRGLGSSSSWVRGVSFWWNFSAASVGEYNKIILVSSTELILLIGRRKEFQSLRFERKPFVRANGGILGCVCLYAENWATLLVGRWWRENKNKLVE